MHLHPSERADPTTPAAAENAPATHRRRRSRTQQRLWWLVGAALLLALLILTPPLVNANRYRGRIAQAMSDSLGRPVHLDSVSMHLLPVPGFTLQNFVVSENPAFGSEPTIRANSVEATLRMSSLWHRPLEFSRVHFDEPSVNLVRNPDGRWNLGDVLLHASHVESAPTVQRRAGPAPRFPYVEATGGRINVKSGPEKLPFSLTDADFSLWQPSSQQWRMRLEAHPARTDTNITDPGKMQLEGELHRAPRADAVPVNFTGSWHDAPLGEVSRILTGEDGGWRGSLNMDASLSGTLGDGHLATKVTLGGLRRAEFFPARTLDLQVTCGSGFTLNPVTLGALQCVLPDDAPTPLTLQVTHLALSSFRTSPVALKGTEIPARWALLWAGLFSPRIGADTHPRGTLDIDFARGASVEQPLPSPAEASSPHGRGRKRMPPTKQRVSSPEAWTGQVQLHLPDTVAPGAEPVHENELLWTVVPGTQPGEHASLRLPPTPLTLGDGTALTLAGTLSTSGYSLSVNGTAAPALLLLPARTLPQLGDGLADVLPADAGTLPARVQFTCSRGWREPQTCTDALPGHPAPSVP